MRKIIVSEFMTLDGVVQAPGGADEDTDGGFSHGGWQMPYGDELFGKIIMEGIASAGGFLLGRRTYDIFAGYWPNAPEEEAAIAAPLNELPKYVASRTLSEPLEWQNSTLLAGEVPEAVAALKEQPGKDIHVIGSGNLVQTLMRHNLVDEYLIMIHPLALGGGKRLFQEGSERREFHLADSQVSTTGVIMATYRPAGA
jgi:dihydrofolate reductase